MHLAGHCWVLLASSKTNNRHQFKNQKQPLNLTASDSCYFLFLSYCHYPTPYTLISLTVDGYLLLNKRIIMLYLAVANIKATLWVSDEIFWKTGPAMIIGHFTFWRTKTERDLKSQNDSSLSHQRLWGGLKDKNDTSVTPHFPLYHWNSCS